MPIRVLFLSLFLLGLCSAQESAFIGHSEPRVVSDLDRHLQAYLEVWQVRLNLRKWKIAVLVVPAGDLKAKTLGNIHWDVLTMSAVIRVLSPEDYNPKVKNILDDMEETIVHELIHLSLVPFQPENGKTDEERGTEEVVISKITQAFLALDRRSK